MKRPGDAGDCGRGPLGVSFESRTCSRSDSVGGVRMRAGGRFFISIAALSASDPWVRACVCVRVFAPLGAAAGPSDPASGTRKARPEHPEPKRTSGNAAEQER